MANIYQNGILTTIYLKSPQGVKSTFEALSVTATKPLLNHKINRLL